MAEPEDVMVRGMVVVVVAVRVAPAPGPGTVGREEERERDRERQVMRDPSTGARLTGSLLSAAGAR